jgi:hypothetical protein
VGSRIGSPGELDIPPGKSFGIHPVEAKDLVQQSAPRNVIVRERRLLRMRTSERLTITATVHTEFTEILVMIAPFSVYSVKTVANDI